MARQDQRSKAHEQARIESELDRLLSDFESGSLGKKPILSSTATFPLGCAIVCVFAFATCTAFLVQPFIATPLLIAGLILPFWLNRFIASESQMSGLKSLASYDDVRVVPPMI